MKIEYIDTDIFDQVIEACKTDDWVKTYEYDNIVDKGVDYDKLIFSKNGREIVFEWTNWLEGSAEGNEHNMEFIQNFITKFKYGPP